MAKIAFFDTHGFDRAAFEAENAGFGHEIEFFESRLVPETAGLAAGFSVVCAFVNDRLSAATLEKIAKGGVRLIALRSVGFNNVDLAICKDLGVRVVRVPAYSPHAVAEHAVALILDLNRKIHRAYMRVRELNFSLDGLVGFDLNGKTVGVAGTGRIGGVFAQIMRGFGCRILAFDRERNSEVAAFARYVDLRTLYRESDIVSLHLPLTPDTHYMINAGSLAIMKPGAMLINTGRGALIDARALIQALKSGKISAAGLDVYEEEEAVFFRDLSDQVLQDDVLARLLTFPNVLITSHQAFLTHEALRNIAETTLANISSFEKGRELPNEVTASEHLAPRAHPEAA